MLISLNGAGWSFKGFYGEDWVWRNSHQPNTRDRRGWHPGRVPGSVQNDLWQCGEIPDPYFERNSLLSEWVPDRTWLYKKAFFTGEELRGKRIRLCFKGVDYEAQFFLNGELLGDHCGMFTPAVFEVGDRLKYAEENLLAVVIEPAPYEQPQVGRTSKVYTQKSRMNYWWDFCPRMVHLGIWDEVYLAVSGDICIEGVFVRPQLTDDLSRALVAVETQLSCTQPAEVEVTVDLYYGGERVAGQVSRRQILAGPAADRVELQIENPHLWWPNGYGQPELYTAEVRVTEPGSGESPSDQRNVRFGIRRLEFIPNEASDRLALPYTLRVNGRKMYAKGWNWVPIDALYGVERPEKLKRLLMLAKRAHVNLLRVWGGGLIEKDAFYDLCDEAGILVWQEFIQSSSGIENEPSSSPDFVRMMADTAEQVVPARRNHPSLAIWCGGNELQSGPERPLDDGHPVLAALHAVVERLDPDRPWLPTSPSGPVFSSSLENIARDPAGLHDVHGPWEHQGLTGQCELYNRGTSLFHSEFGVEGITNQKTLDRVISKDRQWPVSLDNPVWEHLGAWWVKERSWREIFGEWATVEAAVQATQFLQADGLRYAVEADRRRKYQNSGSLPWQFNEPYPMAACTSAVDYYAIPKPVYYAVARAYEPVHVSARFPALAWVDREVFSAEAWVSNSEERSVQDAGLEMRIVGPGGRCYRALKQDVSFPANRATRLAELYWPLAEIQEMIFFLDLILTDAGGREISHSRYVFSRAHNLAPLFDQAGSELKAAKVAMGTAWEVTLENTGRHTALFVWLEDARPLESAGYCYFSDNAFCLFPGEVRKIGVEWDSVPREEREITIQGWNTPGLKLGAKDPAEGMNRQMERDDR